MEAIEALYAGRTGPAALLERLGEQEWAILAAVLMLLENPGLME